MAAAKPVNYTAEQTLAVVEGYKNGTAVAELAAMFGKTTRSIVAKLSREGVYEKAEYVSKTGEKPIKKEVLADEIGTILGMNENDTTSLEKANKNALDLIVKALRQ